MLDAMLHVAGEVFPIIDREKLLGGIEVEFQPSSDGLVNSMTVLQIRGPRSGGSGVATTSLSSK